jgi:hypothetical protein
MAIFVRLLPSSFVIPALRGIASEWKSFLSRVEGSEKESAAFKPEQADQPEEYGTFFKATPPCSETPESEDRNGYRRIPDQSWR